MALPSPAHAEEKVSPLETQPIAFPGGFKDATEARKKRSRRRDACYDKRSDSWVGNGCRPDGSRWRRQGFPDFESAKAWALQTKGQMDDLAYQAADLPMAIRRDVAHAMGVRSQAGLNPYEEGLFTRLVREDNLDHAHETPYPTRQEMNLSVGSFLRATKAGQERFNQYRADFKAGTNHCHLIDIEAQRMRRLEPLNSNSD
jgi:hypothetical protein